MAGGINMVMKLVKKVDRTADFARALNNAVWPVIKNTGQRIDTKVKQTAPFKTGNLRRSYHLQLFRSQLSARVGSDPNIAPYTIYLEYGTSKMAAQPHLGPAGENERNRFTLELQTAVRKIVRDWSGAK